MKNKLYILVCLLAMGLSGCNNWLDVRPDTEVYLDDMYSDQQGFQDALTGAYLKMKSFNAYGQCLMYNDLEFLAQHWDYTSGSADEELSRYNYQDENVQAGFESIYSSLYSIIAAANLVLEQIDGKRNVFEQRMYEIIKGEALAMRAFCHFDLLRLFGPMPTKTDGSRILPYVTTVGIDYHEHHTYETYTALLEADLLQADSLLKAVDPVIPSIALEREETEEELSVSGEDFLQERQIRFNYYAVKGLEARFYLWLGGADNKAKAYACAKEIIDAVDEDGANVFSLGTTSDISVGNYSFTSEHILAIYEYDLGEMSDELFAESSPFSKARNLVTSDLFTAGTTDIRLQLWAEFTAGNGSKSYTIQKFKQPAVTSTGVTAFSGTNQLPLIRLSEMYFIAMECGTLAEANELYEAFCLARDIPLVEITNENQLENILIDEYNKEFYGEGQAFYAFKRLAVEDILWAQDPGNEESYVVPLPLNEVSYNN